MRGSTALNLFSSYEPQYKTTEINNRRYLGNKYRLLSFITAVINSECKDIKTFADIFAGTGAVSSAFRDKVVITNDLMYSNYICNYAWFGCETFDRDKIIDYIVRYNSLSSALPDNYMTENFADTYFSRADCAKIGYIREDIEYNYVAQHINMRERAILITSLLYAMDRIANTCGHYDAYRKGAAFERCLELCVPLAATDNNPFNKCYNEDANMIVRRISADVVYIDPPYNSRQYCDAYHLLENVALWAKPKLCGVARKPERTGKKSRYCTKEATTAFADLIENVNARYIVLSYNNMACKGNNRSNAKLPDRDIMRILEEKGEVKVFAEDYKPFTTGKSEITGNQERLFVCNCFKEK